MRIPSEHFYFRSKFHRNWTNIKEISFQFSLEGLWIYYFILYLATTKNTFQTYSQGCLWFWLLLHGQICLFEAMLFFKVSVNDVYIFEKMKLVGYLNIKHNVPWHHSRSKKFLWNNIDSWRSFLHNLSVHWYTVHWLRYIWTVFAKQWTSDDSDSNKNIKQYSFPVCPNMNTRKT